MKWEQRHVLLMLHEIEGIGWITIDHLRKSVTPLQNVLYMKQQDFVAKGLDPHRSRILTEGLQPDQIVQFERKLERYEQLGIGWITYDDREYPYVLQQISEHPPWVVYYKGQLELLDVPGLAIVGTRVATVYGKKVAFNLAKQLAMRGICIVSGMARGIDSEAHRGALSVQGATIGVLGTGLEQMYPPENRKLYESMYEHGLLISEYPVGTRVAPGLFPLRNRIIAGLTMGTLVVEAAERSGALITADKAMDFNRDVFVIPGPITSPKSLGPMGLLKQGAILVTSAHDILAEYEHMLSTPLHNLVNNTSDKKTVLLTKMEQQIYDLLSEEPTTIDELFAQTQINFGLLHSVLLSLLVKNKIAQLPSSSYITK